MAKKGLVIGLAVGLPVLLVGGAAGLGVAGIIKIPGLTKQAPKGYGEATEVALDVKVEPDKSPEEPETDPAKAEEEPKPQAKPEPEPEPDKKAGAKKLAGIWNNVESASLAKIVEEYSDDDLALVFLQMDKSKVAEILGTMDGKRAGKVSKKIEEIAAVPAPTGSQR